MIVFSSCKIGQTLKDFNSVSKDAKQIAKDFRDVRGAVVPVDTLLMNATAGLLTELSNADSQTKLDSISARINRILTLYLNATFQNLDPGPVGKKFTQGALDPLLAAETEERMKKLIAALSAQMSHDIAGMITELASPANKAKLNSLLSSFFSEANSKVVSAFINRSLRDIEFDSLGSRIANELVSQNLKPQFDSVARTAVRAIFDEISHNKNAKGIFGNIKNILFLALGLLGIIIGLFFWWSRRKSMKLNTMLINSIEDLKGNVGKDVKEEVAKKARNEGLLPHLDKVLKQHHLLNRSEGVRM
jgi:hypothetical protein